MTAPRPYDTTQHLVDAALGISKGEQPLDVARRIDATIRDQKTSHVLENALGVIGRSIDPAKPHLSEQHMSHLLSVFNNVQTDDLGGASPQLRAFADHILHSYWGPHFRDLLPDHQKVFRRIPEDEEKRGEFLNELHTQLNNGKPAP